MKVFKNPFVLATLLYISLVILINPVGEFAINDDWLYVRQVEHGVLDGIFKLSSYMGPSFIAQNLLGIIWGIIFGVSFTSLRILTILITILVALGAYRILKYFKISNFIILISLLLIFFNPVVFTSSMSFMSEIYIVFGFVWSTYFYIRGFKENLLKFFILGSIFAAFSLLVRHIGITLFISFFLLLPFIEDRKVVFRKIFIPNFIIFISSLLLLFFWPRYQTDKLSVTPGFSSLFSNVLEIENIGEKCKMMLLSIPYYGFFIFPLISTTKLKLTRFFTLLFWFAVLFLSYVIFKFDIFAVGSVFYIEELYVKSYYRFDLSLFNNIPFKIFISSVTSLCTLKIIYIIVKEGLRLKISRKFISRNIYLVFMSLVSLLGFSINFFTQGYYERYFIPPFIIFLILIVILFCDRFLKRRLPILLGTFLMIFISFTLQFDYFSHTRIRWRQAETLQKNTGLINGIFVDGVYARYYNSKKSNDYTGEVIGWGATNFSCYVEKNTFPGSSSILSMLKSLEKLFEKKIENPRAYNSSKPQGLPSVKKNLDRLFYYDEYFSPLYSIIGKKAFVGSWCDKEFLDKISPVQ
ncbi:hypothetical protein ACFLZ4_01335 [Patescibacteria group bacterium]